jgi:Sel1 repeat
MALHKVLPVFAILYLFVSVAPAQAPLPTSTQAQLATNARLESMSLDDFTKVVSQAQAGQRETEYLVALAYDEGRLVTRDHVASASWMLKSAEQEYVPAQAGMGRLYIAGVKDNGPIPHRSDAEKWFRLAAAQGDADAQFWLGAAYQRGWFGAFNDQEALKWLGRPPHKDCQMHSSAWARCTRMETEFPRATPWPQVGTGRQRTTLLHIWVECGKLRFSWLTCIAMAD